MPLETRCCICAECRCVQCGVAIYYCLKCFEESHSLANILHVAEVWDVSRLMLTAFIFGPVCLVIHAVYVGLGFKVLQWFVQGSLYTESGFWVSSVLLELGSRFPSVLLEWGSRFPSVLLGQGSRSPLFY